MIDPFIIIINVAAVPQAEEAMDTSEGEGTTSDTSTLTWLLGELLDNYVNKTQPSVRQVSSQYTNLWTLGTWKKLSSCSVFKHRIRMF